MIKIKSLRLNLITLFSILFFMGGLIFGIFALNGVVIVVTFMSKMFIILSFIFFVIAVILFFIRNKVKITGLKADGG